MGNKKCLKCKGNMEELKSKTPEGVSYTYYKCKGCREEILNMDQLHEFVQKYRKVKKL